MSQAIGQRLDRALADALGEQGVEITRSQLARSFSAGGVRVGGRRAKPSFRVESETLMVEVDLVEPPPLAHAEPEDIPLTIVHEDAALMVVDKPAGMVVHAGPGHPSGTLVNAVLHHLKVAPEDLPLLSGNGPERPGIVHRLDRDTSGLIVVAKTLPALAKLAEQFRVHSIERAYLGIVMGVPSWSERTIQTSHGRDPVDRRRFSPNHGTRRAVTHMIRRTVLGERATLMQFTLETGRTHQIRMHARHVGHPIFADSLYGGRGAKGGGRGELRELAEGLGRHALHAALLGFEHPDGGRLRLESKLPSELAAVVATLGGDASEAD